jgi:SPP1 family predicted phage head-tail adaptor
MQAGRLRHRVSVQEYVTTQDSETGSVSEAWATMAEMWAEVKALSGREFVAAQTPTPGVTTRITIRHLDNVDASKRIQHGDTIYNIKAVLPDPTFKRHLTLMCEQGVNRG